MDIGLLRVRVFVTAETQVSDQFIIPKVDLENLGHNGKAKAKPSASEKQKLKNSSTKIITV